MELGSDPAIPQLFHCAKMQSALSWMSRQWKSPSPCSLDGFWWRSYLEYYPFGILLQSFLHFQHTFLCQINSWIPLTRPALLILQSPLWSWGPLVYIITRFLKVLGIGECELLRTRSKVSMKFAIIELIEDRRGREFRDNMVKVEIQDHCWKREARFLDWAFILWSHLAGTRQYIRVLYNRLATEAFLLSKNL